MRDVITVTITHVSLLVIHKNFLKYGYIIVTQGSEDRYPSKNKNYLYIINDCLLQLQM